MHRTLFCAMVAFVFGLATANAANDKDPNNTGGTAKGAAVGALAGHEMGSGHAGAGAATGAAIGHHDKKQAEKQQPQTK